MNETRTQQQQPHATHADKQSREGFWSRLRHKMEMIGNNVDQINLFARMKDTYKIFESISDFVTLFIGANLGYRYAKSEHEIKSLADEINHNKKINLGVKIGVATDVTNTAYQMGLSRYSYWLEKREMQRSYGGIVQEELGLTRPATFEDMKRSQNPIIRDTAHYYTKKNLWRSLPDLAGLIRVVPFILGAVSQKARESNFVQALKLIPGIKLGLGMKTAFFGWYFASRQTGTNYALRRIWDKTEGQAPNLRSFNHGVLTGELVNSEEITKLYSEYTKDYEKREFTVNDPLTGRIFEQIARQLNYNYMPDLYLAKRAELFEEGPNQEKGRARKYDLMGTNMTHAKLVEFVGSDGVDVDDALLTAIRLEVLARKGVTEYRQLNEQLTNVHRPSTTLSQEEYEQGLIHYFDTLSHYASNALGEAWPPYYVARMSDKIINSYLKENPNVTIETSKQLRQHIERSFGFDQGSKRSLVTREAIDLIRENSSRAAQEYAEINREAASQSSDLEHAPGEASTPPAPTHAATQPSNSTEFAGYRSTHAATDPQQRVKPRTLADFAISHETVPEGASIN